MSDATRLIDALGDGNPDAAATLFPLIYDQLRQLARAQMGKERSEHTLEATALVHEAYLRLMDGKPAHWDGRRHFFAAAAEAMRRILVEHARRRNSLKRGGHCDRVPLDDDQIPFINSPCDDVADVIALNDALDRLAAEHPDKAELVKLLYFAGLNLDESAAALRLSRTTAHRHWTFARAWLFDAMGRTAG